MIAPERHRRILDMLARKRTASLQQLCALCPGVSTVTLRRDLASLEAAGRLRRTHGGAMALDDPAAGADERLEEFDALVLPPVRGAWAHTLRQNAIRKGTLLLAESAPQVGGTYLGPHNLEQSRQLGAFAARQLSGRGPVELLLVALEGLQNTRDRVEGFRRGFEQNFEGSCRVYRVNGRGLLKEVIRQVSDAFEAHPQINVIFGVNDHTILGALEVADRLGAEVSAYSVGGEGSRLFDELARDKALKAVLALFPEVVGQAAVDSICAAFDGRRLGEAVYTPAEILTPDNLEGYYARHEDGWRILPSVLEAMGRPYRHAGKGARNRSIGFMLHYPSHEWYRGLAAAMRKRAAELGAMLVVRNAEDEVADQRRAIKRRIGEAAAALITPGETLLVDGGDCSLHFAEVLRAADVQVQVYTNALKVMETLSAAPNIRVFLTGGEYQAATRTLVGPSVGTMLETIRVDRAVVSPDGVSPSFGLSFEDERAALVCRRFCAAARQVEVLADHGVVALESSVQAVRLADNHTVFTDVGTLSAHRLELSAAGCGVVVCDEDDVRAGMPEPALNASA